MIKFYGQKRSHNICHRTHQKIWPILNDRTFDFQSFDWTVFGQLIITVIIIFKK